MNILVCDHEYKSKASGRTYRCTHHKGHHVTELTDHSWEWIRRAEEDPPLEGGPPEIEELIEGIAAGVYDPYIESLLAALHGRKRANRNVPHPYGRNEE